MTKEKRQKNAASKKKGRGITLLKKETILDGDTNEHEVMSVLATENEGIRTRKDVKEWMNENNYIGTVYPCRIDKCITRSEQKKIAFKEGE